MSIEKSASPTVNVTRKLRTMKAFDDEWVLIKQFSELIKKKGKRRECEEFLKQFNN